MGYVKVKARVSNPARNKSIDIELIADTGAIYTAIPANLLQEQLGIAPTGKRKFKLASGEVKDYPVSEAYIEIEGEGEGVTSLVAFIPKGSTPLLGVTTLELLGLQVDPIAGELKPIELLLL